jgi:CDP-diacylglycerol--glycerol-3-phosphate 3-phosphatidyltransferase
MKWKWTIPNMLSLYRLCSVPYLLYLIYSDQARAFAWLFCTNLITDVLDGFLARRFNMGSEIGVMLDSWADFGSYFLAIVGMIHFHPEVHTEHGVLLGAYLFFYIAQLLYSKYKFGVWVAGWHAYSTKVSGYIQGIFFAVLFAHGYVHWLFLAAVISHIITESELMALCYICPQRIPNVKGLYWYLKSTKQP